MMYDSEKFLQPRTASAYAANNVKVDALSVERKPDKVVTMPIDNANAECVCEGYLRVGVGHIDLKDLEGRLSEK